MKAIEQAPFLYVFALSLHLIGGNFFSSLVYKLRFGKSPNLLLSKKPDPAHRSITRRLSLVVVCWVLLFLRAAFFPGFLAGVLLDPVIWISPLVGWLVFGGGLIGMFVAQFQMGRAFRIGQGADRISENLKTDGLWSLGRNPIYLFSYLSLAGAGLWAASPVMILVLLVLAYYFHRMILVEETYLEGVFGREYIDYKARTLRYIGRRKQYE